MSDVPFVPAIAHIFEICRWNNITFGSQGDTGLIHRFLDFDLGMTPCVLDLFLGGLGFSRKTI